MLDGKLYPAVLIPPNFSCTQNAYPSVVERIPFAAHSSSYLERNKSDALMAVSGEEYETLVNSSSTNLSTEASALSRYTKLRPPTVIGPCKLG